MTPISIVLWVSGILLTCSALALAVVAVLAPRRRQLALVALVPVVVVLAAAAVTAPGALGSSVRVFPLLLSLGIAALGVIAGNPLVALVLSLSSREDSRLGAHGGILVRDANAPAPAQREILRGGTTIGYLERFALIGSVVAGQGAAVALIVAVKGLGRFSELENERARERFIIGTLASLTWGGMCAAAIAPLH